MTSAFSIVVMRWLMMISVCEVSANRWLKILDSASASMAEVGSSRMMIGACR